MRPFNETVDACKELNKPGAAKLLNAILTPFPARTGRLECTNELKGEDSYLYNHPEWMIAKLKNNWPEHWQAILEANNDQAPLTLAGQSVAQSAVTSSNSS